MIVQYALSVSPLFPLGTRQIGDNMLEISFSQGL
jgi:hypothetical protein